jgi:hypothetical protein
MNNGAVLKRSAEVVCSGPGGANLLSIVVHEQDGPRQDGREAVGEGPATRTKRPTVRRYTRVLDYLSDRANEASELVGDVGERRFLGQGTAQKRPGDGQRDPD